MSGSWDALVADATGQLRTDHGLAQAAHESRAREANRMRYGVSYAQGHRRGWWDAVQWLLARQAEWDALTESEAILELRKGLGSIYQPLFSDDPKVRADCPRDGWVTVDASGICDACLYDFCKGLT